MKASFDLNMLVLVQRGGQRGLFGDVMASFDINIPVYVEGAVRPVSLET